MRYGFGQNPRYTLVACAIGIVVVGAFAAVAEFDSLAYANDRSCTSGFPSGTLFVGSCTVDSARIARTYTTHAKSGTTRHVVLALRDGTSQTVDLVGDDGGRLWAGALAGADRIAIVQRFRGRVVRLATNSGTGTTSRLPSHRVEVFVMTGIVLLLGAAISVARILTTASA